MSEPNDSKRSGSMLPVGLAMGMAIGAGIGVAMDDIALGIGIGTAIGIALGVAFEGAHQKGEGEEPAKPADDDRPRPPAPGP